MSFKNNLIAEVRGSRVVMTIEANGEVTQKESRLVELLEKAGYTKIVNRSIEITPEEFQGFVLNHAVPKMISQNL